ncbi:MAG: S9 family peptidase [Acidobacteriota bacterium]
MKIRLRYTLGYALIILILISAFLGMASSMETQPAASVGIEEKASATSVEATVGVTERHAITFDDLFSFGRLSAPAISPDGRTVAFTVTYYSKDENKSNSDIWLAPVDGGEARQLTNSQGGDSSPVWSHDGKKIAFISDRDGESQVYLISIEGGEARKETSLSTGASGVLWSPDGKHLAFTSNVYPDCPDDKCNKEKNDARDKSQVKAKIIESLFFRIWNRWADRTRSHLFIVPADGERVSGEAKDLTPGDFDVPPLDLGGAADYAFSPDGKEIAFVKNTDPVVARSTNNDIFIIPVEGGAEKRITTNKATDNQPVYSPDGRYIAYRAMARPGFEADKYSLMLYDRKSGETIDLTDGQAGTFDSSVGDVVWSPDSRIIYFECAENGGHSIFRISVPAGNIERIFQQGTNTSLRITPDGKKLLFLRQTADMPSEIFTIGVDGKGLKKITSVNDKLLATIEMNKLEEFWFEGAEKAKVHAFLLKPPAFDASKKYPAVFLIHGGPQGAWNDEFHYRWNGQMFASPGYVVVMINPRGSTGFGQKFCDEISGDWGGKVYEDIMKGVDFALENYPFIDKDRIAAAGASYGGYMINWIAGHTDRFRCLISHDGIFNLASMYGTTEELWFPEWEFKGTPWTNPELYKHLSPGSHVKNFKTPMLVVHGGLDFRVDQSEAFQLFTALQWMGIPSKLLYFPDEGHFVLKPKNAELWWKTVHGWLARWLQ